VAEGQTQAMNAAGTKPLNTEHEQATMPGDPNANWRDVLQHTETKLNHI